MTGTDACNRCQGPTTGTDAWDVRPVDILLPEFGTHFFLFAFVFFLYPGCGYPGTLESRISGSHTEGGTPVSLFIQGHTNSALGARCRCPRSQVDTSIVSARRGGPMRHGFSFSPGPVTSCEIYTGSTFYFIRAASVPRGALCPSSITRRTLHNH